VNALVHEMMTRMVTIKIVGMDSEFIIVIFGRGNNKEMHRPVRPMPHHRQGFTLRGQLLTIWGALTAFLHTPKRVLTRGNR